MSYIKCATHTHAQNSATTCKTLAIENCDNKVDAHKIKMALYMQCAGAKGKRNIAPTYS
jgi:hypothetical protein